MGWGAALVVSSLGVIVLILFGIGVGKWISILIGRSTRN